MTTAMIIIMPDSESASLFERTRVSSIIHKHINIKRKFYLDESPYKTDFIVKIFW